MTSYPSNAELAEIVRLLTKAQLEKWLGEDFGTWRWCLLLALLFIPWFIWYKYANKKQLPELTLFGMIVEIVTITLDELGFVLSWWYYPINVIPVFPRLTSVDYTIFPILNMLIYQYFPTWKSFFWANFVKAVVFAFIAEPLLVKLGFYQLLNWSHLYSFPIYIVTGIPARWVVKKIFALSQRS